jgi:hypothetical protein
MAGSPHRTPLSRERRRMLRGGTELSRIRRSGQFIVRCQLRAAQSLFARPSLGLRLGDNSIENFQASRPSTECQIKPHVTVHTFRYIHSALFGAIAALKSRHKMHCSHLWVGIEANGSTSDQAKAAIACMFSCPITSNSTCVLERNSIKSSAENLSSC